MREASTDLPPVVVFMPTWNCRPWLERAITSVLAQTWPAVELYVGADACDDADSALLEAYPQVTFFRTARRSGPYAIVNLLLRLTQSPFVALHDADDWSPPHRLTAQIEHLTDRQWDGCGGWSRLEDDHGDVLGFEVYPELASQALRGGVEHPALHPTMLYRRHVFQRLGGFDARRVFGADTEFIRRACLAFNIGNVRRFLYHRTVRANALTLDPVTGFGSAARAEYMARVQAGTEAALATGVRPVDVTLLGEPIDPPATDVIEWIRPSATAATLAT